MIEAVPRIAATSSGGDESFLHLGISTPRLPQRAQSAQRGAGGALLLHVTALAIVALMATSSTVARQAPSTKVPAEPMQLPRLVFLQTPGRGGGGGGGGNRQRRPLSRAQAIGRDRLSVPVAKPRIASERAKDTTASPPQRVVLDAKPLASGTVVLAGLPDASPSIPFSQGPGSGGGIGTGTGTGIGAGTGAGMGPGSGGGFGGGAYRLGSGVTPPTLLREVKPKYTAEALRRQIQGTVSLEVVVSRDGIPIAVRVTRSLDPQGLDQEAIAAVRQWRFTPGRVDGAAVDVLVTILLDFTVR